jgi:tetratricopeptide (TPR) repeat protein
VTGAAPRRWPASLALTASLATALALIPGVAPAADDGVPEFSAVRGLCLAGKYAECLQATQQGIAAGAWTESWHLLLIRTLATTGRLDAAASAAERFAERHADSLPALLALYEVRRAGGDRRARDTLQQIRLIAGLPGTKLTTAEAMVAAGQAALRLGDEPSAILETYFDPAIKKDPKSREAYLAAGALSLEKHDDELAARYFREGLKRIGPDADLHHGLARAFLHGDRRELTRSLDASLRLNANHVPSLLLRAEHEIDSEGYPAARKFLDRALAVDRGHPAAHAFHAVLAHLDNDADGEARARDRALARWRGNPEVDSLIGRKLSEKYRFTEGAAAQRRALKLDPDYLPAKILLAENLLRLGKEAEGWALAEEVHAKDGYDAVAYNLVTLRGHLAELATLKSGSGDFLVRMHKREAAVWGDSALALLREARGKLDKQYGFSAAQPVTVEIFPDQADFAVRTFGLPGGGGFLGVCFGNLITMNSPTANTGLTANWKAVLWHEYTHVVTLGLTRNKMPRWLSEGISVFEERRRDPSWGQHMTPRYREMILAGEMKPVGQLSGAFLDPKDGEHLMFAYYQSAMVVEFLVQRFGLEALKAILRDLGAGTEINKALAAHTVPLSQLEKEFDAHARAQAKALGPQADWARPEPQVMQAGGAPGGGGKPADGKALERWLNGHPRSVWGLLRQGERLIAAGQWDAARAPLEKSLALYPDQRGADSAHLLLARVHRKRGDVTAERKALERLSDLSSDALEAYGRLLELGEAARDFGLVARQAERLLAVNPMAASAHRSLGRALEATAAADGAIAAYRRVLALEPTDPAEVHLRLARLLRGRDPRAAKRHVLDALSEAPRYREAHKLLLEMAEVK